MWLFGEPSSSALMKSPAAGMNVSSVPATTPGSESGSVTRRNVLKLFAYRSCAASISRLSICSSDTYSGSAMKGKKL